MVDSFSPLMRMEKPSESDGLTDFGVTFCHSHAFIEGRGNSTVSPFEFSAAERRKNVATGASPWKECFGEIKPRRGVRSHNLMPLRG